MNNQFLPILFLVLFAGCSGPKNSHIIFSGNVENAVDEILTVSNYNSTMREDFPIDSLGNFKARVEVNKGGYYFFKIGRPYSTVRFKKGENVYVNIDADNFFKSRQYSGSLSIENNFNVEKSALRSEFVGDPKDYFVVPLPEFLSKIEVTRDAVFDLIDKSSLSQEDKKLEKRIAEYDYLQTYNNYQKFYSYHKKRDADLPDDYYQPIIDMNIDDDEMFRHSGAYRNLIVANYRHSSKKAMTEDSTLSVIEFVKNKISNVESVDTREKFASMLMRKMKQGNSNIDDDYRQIMPLFSSERMKSKLEAKYKSALETVSGKESVDFNYENFSGGEISLKDLSGKLVYIDVWATWCGPCLKEMPSLKKLVNDYNGKNIEFVSISIDHKKDYEKWRKMVPEKNVGGLQLYDPEGLSSSFMKAFNVGLIPRFMMLDSKGKIITAHAPRPSSDEVRGYIDKHLNGPEVIKFSSK
jgi:thiol-disulfide isomerase/thioredoxin